MINFKVLITKEIEPALLEKAKQELELVQIPFISISACDEKENVTEIANTTASVVFTSKNAVRIVSDLLNGRETNWKIYCTDGATLQQVKDCFGEARLSGTAQNAEALASLIIETNTDTEIVFFCGNKRRDELPDQLKEENIEVKEVVVYETKLSPEEISGHFDGIAFFSPSAVYSYFSVNVADDKTIFFSIGSTTSESLKKFAGNTIITCEKASEENMIATILAYIKTNDE